LTITQYYLDDDLDDGQLIHIDVTHGMIDANNPMYYSFVFIGWDTKKCFVWPQTRRK